jgi:hypothetical protein
MNLATIRGLITRKKWIIGFTLAHVALGLLAAMMSIRLGNARFPNYVVLACWGMIYGLESLVGIWGVMGTSTGIVRATGFVVGVSFAGTLQWLSMTDRSLSLVEFSSVTAASVGVGASLWMACRAGIEVRRLAPVEFTSRAMQFSIRQLMILTAILACVIAPIQWIAPRYPLPQIVVGFLSPWAMLGTRRPLLGLVALCIATLGIGFGLMRPVFVVVVMAQMLLLASSLALVRFRGFRIVNRAFCTELAASKAIV